MEENKLEMAGNSNALNSYEFKRGFLIGIIISIYCLICGLIFSLEVDLFHYVVDVPSEHLFLTIFILIIFLVQIWYIICISMKIFDIFRRHRLELIFD